MEKQEEEGGKERKIKNGLIGIFTGFTGLKRVRRVRGQSGFVNKIRELGVGRFGEEEGAKTSEEHVDGDDDEHEGQTGLDQEAVDNLGGQRAETAASGGKTKTSVSQLSGEQLGRDAVERVPSHGAKAVEDHGQAQGEDGRAQTVGEGEGQGSDAGNAHGDREQVLSADAVDDDCGDEIAGQIGYHDEEGGTVNAHAQVEGVHDGGNPQREAIPAVAERPPHHGQQDGGFAYLGLE